MVRCSIAHSAPGWFHPHFHVLLVVPPAYLEPDSPLYITQPEWEAMWRKALGAHGKRIIDIRVTENPGEVAKYVTKPGATCRSMAMSGGATVKPSRRFTTAWLAAG